MKPEDLESEINSSSYITVYLFFKALQEKEYYLPTFNECNACWKW